MYIDLEKLFELFNWLCIIGFILGFIAHLTQPNG